MRNGRTVPQCGKRWTGSGSFAREQFVVSSRLRFAAGVCVLAAGLLMGSAAVAVADPDSSNSSAHGDGGTNAPSQGSTTASSPVGNVADTQRNEIHRPTSTFGSGRRPGEQPSPGNVTDTQQDEIQRRNKRAWLGPATRRAAFPRREKAGARAWRRGHQGRARRRGHPGGEERPDPVAAIPNDVTPAPDVTPSDVNLPT